MPVATTKVQVTFPIATARRLAKLAEKDSRSLANYVQRLVELALAKIEH